MGPIGFKEGHLTLNLKRKILPNIEEEKSCQGKGTACIQERKTGLKV